MKRWLLVLTGCFSPSFQNGNTPCLVDRDCPPSFHCAMGNTCWANGSEPDFSVIEQPDQGPPDEGPDLTVIPPKHQGEACGPTDTCDTGHCTDGYCCESDCTDSCKACNVSGFLGMCTNLGAGVDPVGSRTCNAEAAATCGRDGKCDGSGVCRNYLAGSPCSSPSCNVGTGDFVPASLCDGAGTCVPTTGYNCDPYKCKDTTACFGPTCSGTPECSGANTCVNMSCGLLADGRQCTLDGQCTNGHCVDGNCCNSSCTGSCQACDVVSKPGICTTVTAGLPHGSRSCTNQGMSPCGGRCDGTNPDCHYEPNTTSCGTTCTSTTQQKLSFCDQAGACVAQAPSPCGGNLLCVGSACLAMCGADTDCQSGFGCNSGKMCVGHCIDGHKDFGETDVDCGGTCSSCNLAQQCLVDGAGGDCATGSCYQGYCTNVTGPPFWLSGPAHPGVSENAMVSTTDGRVWTVDGVFNTSGQFTSTQYLAMGASNWLTTTSTEPSAALGGYLGAAVGSDGHFYIIGGYRLADAFSAVVSTYDPGGDSWSSVTSINPGRRFHAVVARGGIIYSVGGQSSSSLLANLDSFTPGGSSWSSLAPMPGGARAYLVAAVGSDNLIYAIGGETATALVGTVEVYHPASNTWSTAAPLGDPRELSAAASGSDGRIFVIGGDDAAGFSGVVEAYTPSINKWAPVAALPAVRGQMGAAIGGDGRIYVAGGNSAGSNTPTGTVYIYGPLITIGAAAQGTTANGSAGSVQTLNGSNFAANATVTVSFNNSVVASGTTNASGVVSPAIMFTVPSLSAGVYTIKAVDSRAFYPALAKFSLN